MRCWLPRSLWLLAWSFWAWLGWGLYRELPRSVAGPVCRLDFDEGEKFVGFLREGRRAVSMNETGLHLPRIVHVWDAVSGALISRYEGPLELRGGWEYVLVPQHALMVAQDRPPLPGRRGATGPSVLDLETGTWIDLPIDADGRFVYHHSKPWAAVYWDGEEGQPRQVVVLDLRTGTTLFAWDDRRLSPSKLSFSRRLAFAGDALLAIPVHRPWDNDDVVDERLQVWSIADGRQIGEYRNVAMDDDPQGTPSGRIAWRVDTDPPGGADVFDASVGAMVFSYPAGRKLFVGGHSGQPPPVVLSEDGGTILCGMPARVLDVNSGRELWRFREYEEWGRLGKRCSIANIDPHGAFSVGEEWTIDAVGDKEWTTCALHSLSTGRLLYRYWTSSRYDAYSINSAGDLAYCDDDHSIHAWPPRVNNALVAICQAILALPLILLWVAVMWRRKRRLRLASAAP